MIFQAQVHLAQNTLTRSAGLPATKIILVEANNLLEASNLVYDNFQSRGFPVTSVEINKAEHQIYESYDRPQDILNVDRIDVMSCLGGRGVPLDSIYAGFESHQQSWVHAFA